MAMIWTSVVPSQLLRIMRYLSPMLTPSGDILSGLLKLTLLVIQ